MSLNAQAIRALADKGLTASDIADIAEANAPVRSSSAERQKRYRANGGDKIGARHGDGAVSPRHPIERPCGKCGAQPSEPCIGARGAARKGFHRERGSRSTMPTVAHGHRTESPIEDDLATAITSWLVHHDIAYAVVTTQVPLGPYRLDMLVTVGGNRLVVESDGVTFHSSRAAIERDKRRDRYCVTQGYAVMRFTGAEIKRDVRGCAAQVGLWIRAQR